MPQALSASAQELSESGAHKKSWLDMLMELAVAFRNASLASGGATVVSGSNSDTISTNDVFLNQAALAIFFSGIIFLLAGFSILSDICSGKAAEGGTWMVFAKNISGKKRQLALSALFSGLGGGMMFSQTNIKHTERNPYIFVFSILAQLFSGVLIGTDAAKLPGRLGQFFREQGLVRTDTMGTLSSPSFRQPSPRSLFRRNEPFSDAPSGGVVPLRDSQIELDVQEEPSAPPGSPLLPSQAEFSVVNIPFATRVLSEGQSSSVHGEAPTSPRQSAAAVAFANG